MGLSALLGLACAAPAPAQQVIYVRAGATGPDGSSWARAYGNLQNALAAAVPPVQVWVAAGTYRPTTGPNRDYYFSLRSGVALFGGFAGVETELEQRDWTANPTVLSGEIGNATPNDNSYHVLAAHGVDSTAVLDGFTITGGMANGPYPSTDHRRRGAGLFNSAASPTVRNCVFRGNASTWYGSAISNSPGSNGRFQNILFDGDAVFVESSEATFSDIVVTENNTARGMVLLSSNTRLQRATFTDNDAGGLYVVSGPSNSVECIDCVFERNRSYPDDGAGAIIHGGSALFRGCFFGDNSAMRVEYPDHGRGGGAIRHEGGSETTCIDCRFERNEGIFGGAVYTTRASFVCVGCQFYFNEARWGGGPAMGGAVFQGNLEANAPEPLIANSIFVGNTSSGDGGGLSVHVWGRATVVNTTFADNEAGNFGGAIVGGGGVTVINSILWGNQGGPTPSTGEIYGSPPLVNVISSIVRGGYPGESVMDLDPGFVRAPLSDSTTDVGDLRLRAGSLAIDKGRVDLLPVDVLDLDGDGDYSEPLPVDLAWQPRVKGAAPDLGAYEGDVPVANQPVPTAFHLELHSPRPNPTQGSAVLQLDLPVGALVRVDLYDVLGRRVVTLADRALAMGRHDLHVDTRGLATGTYQAKAHIDEAGREHVLTQSLTVAR